MLCKCHWIVLYTVHFTAFCLGGGRFFPDTVYKGCGYKEIFRCKSTISQKVVNILCQFLLRCATHDILGCRPSADSLKVLRLMAKVFHWFVDMYCFSVAAAQQFLKAIMMPQSQLLQACHGVGSCWHMTTILLQACHGVGSCWHMTTILQAVHLGTHQFSVLTPCTFGQWSVHVVSIACVIAYTVIFNLMSFYILAHITSSKSLSLLSPSITSSVFHSRLICFTNPFIFCLLVSSGLYSWNLDSDWTYCALACFVLVSSLFFYFGYVC